METEQFSWRGLQRDCASLQHALKGSGLYRHVPGVKLVVVEKQTLPP